MGMSSVPRCGGTRGVGALGATAVLCFSHVPPEPRRCIARVLAQVDVVDGGLSCPAACVVRKAGLISCSVKKSSSCSAKSVLAPVHGLLFSLLL